MTALLRRLVCIFFIESQHDPNKVVELKVYLQKQQELNYRLKAVVTLYYVEKLMK